MISITGVTGKYILQPGLMSMHQQSLEWLSAAEFWKHELRFFQKLLESNSPKATTVNFKKEMDHLQSIITYYGGEVVDLLKKKVRVHEGDLAIMLQAMNESETKYFKEHETIMNELISFSKSYDQFRRELFTFVEKLM